MKKIMIRVFWALVLVVASTMLHIIGASMNHVALTIGIGLVGGLVWAYFEERVDQKRSMRQFAEREAEREKKVALGLVEQKRLNTLMYEAESYGFLPEFIGFDYLVVHAETERSEEHGDWVMCLIRYPSGSLEPMGFRFPGVLSGTVNPIEFWDDYNARRDAAIERGRMLKQEIEDGQPSALVDGVL